MEVSDRRSLFFLLHLILSIRTNPGKIFRQKNVIAYVEPKNHSFFLSMDTPFDQALTTLPHGPGFRFIDELIALDPGRSARGLYLIKGTEQFLEAHFPGNPIMPGVLMIEAIAQVAGIAAQCNTSDSGSFANLRLAAVSQAKIIKAACPGDQLVISTSITGSMGKLIQAEGQIVIFDEGNENPSPIVKARITLSGAD